MTAQVPFCCVNVLATAQITVLDPGLDPAGRYAALLAGIADTGLGELGSGRLRL